jgi:hypothetical protein
MADDLSEKVLEQVSKAGLPLEGEFPFEPLLTTNRRGESIIQKVQITHGPKQGKFGYADTQGRIWIRDHAHGDYPEHWDVQENGGSTGYTRVDLQGNVVP